MFSDLGVAKLDQSGKCIFDQKTVNVKDVDRQHKHETHKIFDKLVYELNKTRQACQAQILLSVLASKQTFRDKSGVFLGQTMKINKQCKCFQMVLLGKHCKKNSSVERYSSAHC